MIVFLLIAYILIIILYVIMILIYKWFKNIFSTYLNIKDLDTDFWGFSLGGVIDEDKEKK